VIRAVVFDFDGVLANSEPLHFRAFRDVLAEQGLTLTEHAYYSQYLGYDDVGAFRAIAADQHRRLDDAEVATWVSRKAERLEAMERGASVLFPGAREAIARMAKSGPIAIASGALREEIIRVLEREQLTAVFSVVVAAGDTPASKPDPAPYTKAVELSAKSAGLRTIAVTHSYSAIDLHEAELVIDHLDELTSQLLNTFRT
jgi:beta-phosphoglucomutase